MSSSKRKHSDVGQESDNEGQSRNRSVTKERERQWQTVDSSSEDENRSSGIESSASDSSCDDSSGDERKSKRDRKESKDSKKSKKESKHKKSKKDKKDKKDKKHKHKKDHKKDKKERKEKKDSSSHKSVSINQNEYGKYGIIKEENIFHKQREFEAYMAEVRGVPGVMSEGKREVQQHFRTFMEDYNTATMPHEKYYNYERWEMMEYQRSKLEQQQRALSNSEFDAPVTFNDEEIRRKELKRQKEDAENKEFQQLKQKMAQNKDIQGDMRRQAQLSTELQLAFKRGDTTTVKRLERMLAPEEPKMVVKHPWA